MSLKKDRILNLKFFAIVLLSTVSVLAFTSCEDENKSTLVVATPVPIIEENSTQAAVEKTEIPEVVQTETITETPTEQPTPESTEEPTEEPTETPSEPESTTDPGANGIQLIADIKFPEPINPFGGTYGYPYDSSGSPINDLMSWYFNRNESYQIPTAQKTFDIRQFGGYYVGDYNQKVIYLTFDEGYENGYTSQILDVLKEKNVKAAFFVTKPYMEAVPDLTRRMVDEGHIVGNHSVTHKSFPSLSDEQVKDELLQTEAYFESITGEKMPLYFRPPMGEYSARVMKIINELGYKTIFWSLAYKDWEVDNQPSVQKAYESAVKYIHYGAIPLLHAVSKSNTEALPYVIDTLKSEGFEFKTLDDLPEIQ